MYWTFIGICIVVTVFLISGFQYMKKALVESAVKALQKQDFKLYFQILDSTPMRISYAKFNRLYMTLNGAMLQRNEELINNTVDKLLSMKLNRKQANYAYVNVFYYYVNEENKEYSEKLLDKILSLSDDALIRNCKQIYNIMILKEAHYIASMEQQLQDCRDELQKGYLSYMIGLQYEYVKDKENSTVYLSRALDILKGTSFEGNIANLLEKN